MKKIQTALILVLGIVLISSCAKNDLTIIEGHVLEYGTDKPIEGATVEIVLKTVFDWQVYYSVIDEVKANENGYFYWETSDDMGGDFLIGFVNEDSYFRKLCYGDPKCIEVINHLEHYNGNIYLDPYAYLQLHVEDVPEVESDFCRIFGSYLETVNLGLGENKFLPMQITKGNMQVYINRIHDFTGFVFVDSVYIEAHDNLKYFIKY